MGSRGPIGNRSEDLARPLERRGGDQQPVTKGRSRTATVPKLDLDWHPIAQLVWNGVIESGQADFYESSDYAVLYSICEDLSYYKNAGRRSGQMLATIYSALSSLLVTEGDRRRVRLELEGEPEGPDQAKVTILSDYRAKLGVVA